ncbi:hypothetical protein GJU40_07585 [Bacillus lacus]|uniref:Uncharacterized protein n=1 Tax=Metabacillus lacus TaxID=1983721 RepID=A0A7X2IYA2_9BACI|nr:hypothetical protein [Metabacillus lacus]MRX72032.1 hypothetical protein [Metabacillus lacus]
MSEHYTWQPHLLAGVGSRVLNQVVCSTLQVKKAEHHTYMLDAFIVRGKGLSTTLGSHTYWQG